jgi:transcriptional regulator with XRE-family HTH domain
MNMSKSNKLSETVAARIRAVMAARQLGLSDISEFLNMSSDAVSRRLNGKVEFSLSEIEKFAFATGYSPSDFLASSFSLIPVWQAA